MFPSVAARARLVGRAAALAGFAALPVPALAEPAPRAARAAAPIAAPAPAPVAAAPAPPAKKKLAAGFPAFHGGGRLDGVVDGAIGAQLLPLWQVKTGGAVKSSAVVMDGVVYVGSADGKLYALDAETGAVRFTFATQGPVEATPLIDGGRVYVGSSDGGVYALDAATGALSWKFQTGDRVLGGANLAHLPNGETRIVVGSYDHKLYGLDPRTGKPGFSVETGNYVHAVPAIDGDRVVFGGCDGHLRIVDAASGEVLGDNAVGAYMAGSVALGGEHAYLGHYGNAVISVDLDEDKVRWRYAPGSFPFFSSPALTADTVVIGGRDRRVHALDRATGKPRWTFLTQGRVDASPVVAGDTIAVGSADGRLYLLRLSDGKKLAARDLGAAISASPAILAGRIYLGDEEGRVHAFSTSPGTGSRISE